MLDWLNLVNAFGAGTQIGEALWGGDKTATTTTNKAQRPVDIGWVSPYLIDRWSGNTALPDFFFQDLLRNVSRPGQLQSEQANQSYFRYLNAKNAQTIGQDYLARTGQATNQYVDTLDELSQPAFHVAIGGQDVGIVPQRNAVLGDLATSIFGAQTGQAARERDIRSTNQDLLYDYMMKNTPYQRSLGSLQQMWPYIQAIEGWRFGLPQVSATESASYDPSLAERMAKITDNAQVLSDLWNSMQGNTSGVPAKWKAPEYQGIWGW